MKTLAAPPRSSRLLAGWRSTHRADLSAHLETYGELPLPSNQDVHWRGRHLEELRASGLRGRGGAGFPAWRKLDSLLSANVPPLVVVNTMEGEPASAKDRVLIECAPHLVLDGAQLTAMAAGACRIVVCVPDDRTRTAESIYRAAKERISAGLDPVHVDVARPPGGFVAGEESALVSWLDRQRSLPTHRVDKSIPLASRGVRRSFTTPRHSPRSPSSLGTDRPGSAKSGLRRLLAPPSSPSLVPSVTPESTRLRSGPLWPS